MATRNETHVHDLSTLTNFKDWGAAPGAALAAFGWVQSNDAGQAVWTATLFTLTQVTVGATAVYAYSSFTGPAPRVGMSATFSGFTNAGNNVTATLTAVSGGSSGTVTVALSTQVNETNAASGTTTVSSVPPSGSSVFEIWQPGDGLQNFFMRIDLANNGGSSPQVKVQIGTGTNGSGTLTGSTLAQYTSTTSTNSGSTLFNCLFSGGTGWFACMIWRDITAGANVFFAVDRSKNSSGSDTSTHVTFYALSGSGSQQQTLVFGVGAALQNGPQGVGTTTWKTFNCTASSFVSAGFGISQAFNGNIKLATVFPFIGYDDNPSLVVAHASGSDFSELATLTTTIYGTTHTYIFSKNQNFSGGTFGTALCMRWE